MKVTIRHHSPADRPAIERCYVALQDFERTLEPRRLPGKSMAKRYISRILAMCRKHDGTVLLAEADGNLAGFVCVLATWPLDDHLNISGTATAFVTDLIVLPAHRRRGLGRKLLDRAASFARGRGASAIRLNVLAANRGAHVLYEAAGYRPYESVLMKPLAR